MLRVTLRGSGLGVTLGSGETLLPRAVNHTLATAGEDHKVAIAGQVNLNPGTNCWIACCG